MQSKRLSINKHFFPKESSWLIQKIEEQLRNSQFIKQFLTKGKAAFLLKI